MNKKESFNKASASGRAARFKSASAKVDLLGELRRAGLKDLGE